MQANTHAIDQDATQRPNVSRTHVAATPAVAVPATTTTMLAQPTRPRIALLCLLATILLAFALRLYRLESQSLWYDEGVTATLAQRDVVELTRWTARDIQPPLYYYVVAGWGRVAGWSEWSLRFISAWWGLLAVPLLALLTQRLTRNHYAPPLAALFTALHPLLVYYSQEARMYTMVVALTLLAGLALLAALRHGPVQVEGAPGNKHVAWIVYIAAATAALYTHYFALFLLPALALAAFFTAPSSGRTRWLLIRQIVVVHLTIGLLFGAWLLPLFTQLNTDNSFWQGEFKVGDAFQGILVRFVVGETVLETQTTPYLFVAAVITLLALARLLQMGVTTRAKSQRNQSCPTLLYGVLWLAFPVGGVLTLALFVPKFNERYVLLALPGLILLWSAGIGAFHPHQRSLDQPPPRPGWSRRLLMALLTLPLLAIFLRANLNWFTDHSFLKAQWREAAAYVRLHHEPGEAVVLVSGHTWPVWEYYAPDLPAIRLPDLEILDVDAVLDFPTSGALLRAALTGQTGAWLVNWQEEVVDPTGVVPVQLAWAGREKTFRSEFWDVGLRRFVELDPTAIPIAPPLVAELDSNFGNQLTLHGYGITAEDELLLFWQRGSTWADLTDPASADPASIDWQIKVRTLTDTGLLYHQPVSQPPTSYTYPVARWQPGTVVMGVIPAAVWAGPAAMPGRYQVQLTLYDPAGDSAGVDRLDPTGKPLGKTITLPVQLNEQTSDRPLTVPAAAVQIDPEIKLHAAALPATGEPGERFTAELLWYLEESFTAATVVAEWQGVDQENGVIYVREPLPLPSGQPMALWPRHDWLRQVTTLQIPPTLTPGDYHLTFAPATRSNRALQWEIKVLPSTRSFVVPNLAQSIGADLFASAPPSAATEAAPQLRLLGLVKPLPEQLTTTTPLTVTLAWQAPQVQETATYDYAISAQLLDRQNRPATQADALLPGGTSSWLPGEVVTQTLTIPPPPEAGTYRLIVAAYQPDQLTNPRLVTATADDFIELAAMIEIQ